MSRNRQKRRYRKAPAKPAASKARNNVSAATTQRSSRSLFHYTTAAGLIGILESESLFATHYNFLNDGTEGQLILDLLLPRMEHELRTATPQLVEKGILKKEILRLDDTLYREEAERMLRAMTSTTNSIAPFFITSFCIHSPGTIEYENGLLSQWRAYARGGFAIEFDELALDELNKIENGRFKYHGIMTNTVTYKNHANELSDEQFGGFARTILRKIFPDNLPAVDAILGSKTTDEFAQPFLVKAPFLKNENFAEENEYRIVALCQLPTVTAPSDKRPYKSIKFRSRDRGNIVPYIALYEELDILFPIKSIIIGPHQNQLDQKTALRILLKKKWLDVPIRLSNIPFRD